VNYIVELDHAGSVAAGASAPSETDADARVTTAERELTALVQRAREGDLRAQSDLARRYQLRLAGFVRPMLRQREAVDDVVQVVLIKMVQRLRVLRDPAVFESWLFTLARNTTLDHLRRAKCRPVFAPDELCETNLMDSRGEENERLREVTETLEVMVRDWGARNRRILSQIAAGSTYREIAECERLSVGAIKLRVHRLRLRLRANYPRSTGAPRQFGDSRANSSRVVERCRAARVG
jgi:RNA polymerase sigma-70 factor, ECF subfamily